MSIANDVRTYAGAALAQGKQVVDQTQARLGGPVALTDKAKETYAGLRERSEALYQRVSALPVVGSVTTAVNGLTKNEQVSKALHAAEFAAGAVIDTVNARVLTPIRSLLEQEPARTTAAKADVADAEGAAVTEQEQVPAKRTTPRRTTAKS